uniref:Uncharacterized protein n=1 Tax=Triticum urartu TaxID=4572 RepID=A0A8R7QWF6_TRIUA
LLRRQLVARPFHGHNSQGPKVRSPDGQAAIGDGDGVFVLKPRGLLEPVPQLVGTSSWMCYKVDALPEGCIQHCLTRGAATGDWGELEPATGGAARGGCLFFF